MGVLGRRLQKDNLRCFHGVVGGKDKAQLVRLAFVDGAVGALDVDEPLVEALRRLGAHARHGRLLHRPLAQLARQSALGDGG